MCGRFVFIPTEEFFKRFPSASQLGLTAQYNIAPSQTIPVITGPSDVQHMKWGLIPSWARSDFKPLINARVETLSEKPAFRDAFAHHRCLIPATGFYEWQALKTRKQPYFFTAHEMLYFAGICSSGTVAIITTAANEVLAPVHNRMPLILSRADQDTWLKASSSPELAKILQPYPTTDMISYPVSLSVNQSHLNDPSLIVPFVS